MPAKIRIGLILLGGELWKGGAEYFTNLIKALKPLEVQGALDLVLFAHEVDSRSFSDSIPGFAGAVVPFDRKTGRGPWWRRTWRRLTRDSTPWSPQLQRFAAERHIDFLYPYFYPYIPMSGERHTVASAAWIPDFQHKLMPHLFSPRELRTRDRLHRRAVRRSDCLVLSSHAAEKDFRTFYGPQRIRTDVLHFHTSAHEQWFQASPEEVLAQYRLPSRFFFCANQFWIHKNHGLLFRALGILKQRGVDVHLVCTGYLGDYRQPAYLDSLKQLVKESRVDDRIAFLGVIPRLLQIQLYRQAVAVVQPSLFEGWSTVVEDCRALGKAILLSDIAVHREQNPPGCRFFDPDSADALADMMEIAWQELPAGPQLDLESAAREQGQELSRAFGRQFHRIAVDAVQSRG